MPDWDQRFPRAGFLDADDTSTTPDVAYKRHKTQIESKALRDSYYGTVIVEDVQGAVCEKHGFVAAQPRPHITVKTMATAAFCPVCLRDQLEAESPPPKEKVRLQWSEARRQPSQREVFAWEDYLSDNEQQLILEGKPWLVDTDLADAAVEHMDITHKAAREEDRLTAEQKFERNRNRRMRKWRKQAKRYDIRFEDETGEPFDFEDEWDRDARNDSWLTRYIRQRRIARMWRRRPEEEQRPVVAEEENNAAV